MGKAAAIPAALAVLLGGCAIVYVAPAPNAPLFEEAGHLQVAGQLGLNGIDAQGAYALTDRLGVIGALSFSPANDDDGHAHFYGELGGGYYLPFLGVGRFDILGGIGGGTSSGQTTVSTAHSTTELTAAGQYVRGFLQGDVGLGTDVVDFGLMARAAYLLYNFREINGERGSVNTSAISLEPALFVRLGYRYVKAEAAFGYVLPLPLEEDKPPPGWLPWMFSLGVRADLPIFAGGD